MRSPTFLLTCVGALCLATTGTLRAEGSAVSIRVEQGIKSDMNPKDRLNRVHSRTLVAFLTNNSGEPLELKVKFIVFGRDMLNHELVTAGENERPVTVKPHSTEQVEAAAIKVTANEAHYDAKTKKKVEASGANIVGSGVQVMQGSTLVAEWYDPASMKEQWGKTKPMTLPGATPAPAKKK